MNKQNQQPNIRNPTLKNISQEDWDKIVEFTKILLKIDQRNNPRKYIKNDRHNSPKNS